MTLDPPNSSVRVILKSVFPTSSFLSSLKSAKILSLLFSLLS